VEIDELAKPGTIPILSGGIIHMELTKFISRLFAELGIETQAEGLTPTEALDMVREKLASMKPQLIDEAVQDAIAAGKLAPDEKDFGRRMAEESLATFKSFVAHRRPIPAIALRGKTKRAVGTLQARINAQCGVSEKLFRVYYPNG
jgi:hypothetical protein